TVVRVESHRRPDLLRILLPFKDYIPALDRGVLFPTANTNKYSVALDISKPEGKEIAKRLIVWGDIVTESFSPGTMKRMGLDYEEASKLNPDIIYFSTSSQGQYGPLASFAAYGAQSASLAGLALLCGHPEHDPVHVYGAYTDFLAPYYLAFALIGALNRRRKTGKGMYLDQSQVESGVTMIAPSVLDYTVNGRIARRMANRDPRAAPHGAYKCQGDDRWITIAVFSKDEWAGFCKTLGQPEWTSDSKFRNLAGRKENEDELDRLVAEWTIKYTAEQVMDLMQAQGVPAGIASTGEDLYNDPQLKHREHFVYLEHKVIGRHAYQNEAIRFSKSPPEFRKAGPCIGEDNEYIYKDILGLSDDDISNLLAEGTITTDLDTPTVSSY
ncbi:CaiB/BaiF CoA transferase family protein, partial [Chloroflexota bacterium]